MTADKPDHVCCGCNEAALVASLEAKLSAALEAKARAERERDEARIGRDSALDSLSGLVQQHADTCDLVRTLTEALRETTKAMAAARDRGFIPTYLLAAWETCLQSGRAALLRADAGQGGEP